MSAKLEQVTELLSQLVAVPSVNPPGSEYDRVQDVIIRWLEARKIAYRVIDINGKPNVLARVGDGSPTLLVNGHVDVVPAGSSGWTRPPFTLTQEGRYLYGRGVTDMKGGLAALLVALSETASNGGPPVGTIVFASTVDEETGGDDGLGAIVRSRMIDVDYALVAEPTNLTVATCEKGVVQLRVVTRGKAAHAAMPKRGINAIERAARAILEMQSLPFKMVHPILGTGSVNVGTISGGQARNVVPDVCEFSVDRRVLPGEKLDEVRAELEHILEWTGARDDAASSFEIEEVLAAPPFETDLGQLIVQAAQSAIRGVLHEERNTTGLSGFTDARFTALEGIPTILLGPGHIAQAHTVDEYVEARQLEEAVDIYSHLFNTEIQRLAHAV